MREMISNFKIKKILLSILITVFIILAFNVKLYASVNKNNKELYEETNLYEYIGFDDNEYNKRKIRNEARYNLDNKSNNRNGWIVDEGAPLLTVITHGLGGSAADWSNNSINYDIFSFSNESLITRLALKENCNIYLATYNNVDNVYTLRNITSEIYSGIKGNIVSFNTKNIGHITDISKHSIVIFESSYEAKGGSNDDVYTEFNYAISNIVKDIKVLNGNKLPKMNLIGHSRGGITNMQYALDHPDLVDSMYSFGTPYLGTTSGSIGYMIKPSLLCSEEAANDLLNPEEYEKYMLRWNNGYYDYYKNINVNVYAGYSTYDQIVATVLHDSLWNFFKDYDSWEEYKKIIIKGLAVEACNYLYPKLMGMAISDIVRPNDINDVIVDTFQQFKIDSTDNHFIDFMRIMTSEITLESSIPFLVFYNDFCVDVGSALGYKGNTPDGINEYKGFKRTKKGFNAINCNMNALSRNMPAVPHNLEARDEELNKYILADIKLGDNKDYLVKNVYDSAGNDTNQVYIEEYVGDCAGDTLTIPSSINGKKVVGISDYAFANNCYGKTNIKTINIPDTVKVIGENAFYNSDCITNINISKDSELEEIRCGAFSNIPNLKSLVIPNNVDYIDEGAFLNSSIASFVIKNNNNYSWQNNILINKNVTDKNNLIAIYVNPDVDEIVIPDSVGIISASLFENNRNIKTINLNNVKHIGTKAFANSTLTNIIGSCNITNVEDYAFVNTPWFDNQDSELITLGKTLISYTGCEKEVVIPEGITRICGNTFKSAEIEEIILPSTIEVVCVDAFTNCDNLKSILFTSIQPPILNGIVANSNVTFFVGDDSSENYINSIYYKNIDNKIEVKKIKVIFYDINGDYLGETEEEYGSDFDNTIEAPIIDGMKFDSWVDLEENEIKNNYISTYKDLKVKPYYKPIVSIHIDKLIQELELNDEEEVELNSPSKDGYEFLGWFDSENGGKLIAPPNSKVSLDELVGIKALYAQYKIINYTITYKTNGGTFINDNLTYTFNVENPITTKDIPEVRKFGYVFDYWLCGGTVFKTTYGIYNDIKLEASYKGDNYNIENGNAITINHEYSIIHIGKNLEKNRLVFTIANNVKTTTFKGNGYNFSNMRIVISNRTDALVLGFEDIIFQPAKEVSGNGLCAVECLSTCDIYISFKGNVEIIGGEGADGRSYFREHNQAKDNQDGVTGWNGQNGCDGGYGIRGDKIIFSQFDKDSFIKVIGGKGGNGGRGENGQQGSDGVNPPSGSIWKPKKGDNGAKGGSGGTGGKGGNGAFGIYVSSSNNLLVSDAMNYRFYGGSGGDGGSGGYGGAGGKGANDVSSNMFNGVGDPGDGGAGGRGGNGGNGGNGSTGSNALNVYGYGGIGGLRGFGNKGGEGGLGGNSGTLGDSGSNGKDGIMGASGSQGMGGIDDYNVIGNELGIKNTPYVFNKDFIIHIFN